MGSSGRRRRPSEVPRVARDRYRSTEVNGLSVSHRSQGRRLLIVVLSVEPYRRGPTAGSSSGRQSTVRLVSGRASRDASTDRARSPLFVIGAETFGSAASLRALAARVC